MSIKVGITSLGCAKNLVDSEVILGFLKKGGVEICDDISEARVIIVNTCSFIGEAKDEAEETIRQLLEFKRGGEIDRLIVAGCLTSLRGPDLAEKFPEVDYFLFPDEVPKVATVVRDLVGGNGTKPVSAQWSAGRDGWFLYNHLSPRVRLSPRHYAYLKIGEGCSNRCSYCMIPIIKGSLKSRRIDSVVEEARYLAADGVKEINLISQDATAYGLDLYDESRLLELLKQLSELNGTRWIRVLYGHPARYREELLEFIASEPGICSYIDFPLQHINDRLLGSMNRRITKTQAIEKLKTIRRLIPGVTVRTTFIVGYPGEEESDFCELLDFVRESRFEHLGAFIYSAEEGAPAARLPKQVPHVVKRERFHRLMALQQQIVREANGSILGKEIEVLVDERLEEGAFRFRGRTEGDAPEVDGTVYISGKDARPGDFVKVRVTGVLDYDLTGELIAGAQAPAIGARG